MNFISLGEKNQEGLERPSENNQISKKSPKSKLSNTKTSSRGFRKKRFFQKKGGVIYIGHIPHGFYEDEMKSYFSQFGKVIATSVSRSRKTGRSKGYGFVQFHDEEVAKIAAETMNNYLMFNKIIKCRYIPPEERKICVYDSKISPKNYPRQKNRKIELRNKKVALLKLNQDTYLQKVQKKIDQFKTFFEKNGVDFTFKINQESGQDNLTKNENKKPVEAENETDNVNGVLEIDESDDEIYFKTPPQVKKVIKKSLNSPDVSQKHLSSITNKISKSNANSKKIQNEGVSNKKVKLALVKKTHKNKKTGKNSEETKSQEVLQKTSNRIKAKNNTSKKTAVAAVKKIKKEKVKRNIDVLKSKKKKIQVNKKKGKE